MAEKEFYERDHFASDPHSKDPVGQFNIMNELIELNRNQNLGLRIIPTIRLLEQNGKYKLIMTRLTIPKLKKAQKEQFKTDWMRQVKVLRENGYECAKNAVYPDAFFPQIDKKTGKCFAIIGDFGAIQKIKSDVQ